MYETLVLELCDAQSAIIALIATLLITGIVCFVLAFSEKKNIDDN